MSGPEHKRQRLVKGSERLTSPSSSQELAQPGGGGGTKKTKKGDDPEIVDARKFNSAPVVWPEHEDPFHVENGLDLMFSCSRGEETFILGDTLEILEEKDGELVAHVCEIESLFRDTKTRTKNQISVRWLYSWDDIRTNVQDHEEYLSTIPPEKLLPSCREIFYTKQIETLSLVVPMRKCYLLPRSEYESHRRLGKHSPYYGRPVYSFWGSYNPRDHSFSKLTTSGSLHEEVLHNRFYMVVYLVSVRHADVNARNEKTDATPLHHAAQYGNTDIMRFLLANGANVNVRDKEGFATMHWAANEGYRATDSLEPMRILYEAGAALDPKDHKGQTPLNWAERTSDLSEVAKFIREKLKEQASHEREHVDGDDVDFRDDMDDLQEASVDEASLEEVLSSQQGFKFDEFTEDTPLSQLSKQIRASSPPRPSSPIPVSLRTSQPSLTFAPGSLIPPPLFNSSTPSTSTTTTTTTTTTSTPITPPPRPITPPPSTIPVPSPTITPQLPATSLPPSITAPSAQPKGGLNKSQQLNDLLFGAPALPKPSSTKPAAPKATTTPKSSSTPAKPSSTPSKPSSAPSKPATTSKPPSTPAQPIRTKTPTPPPPTASSSKPASPAITPSKTVSPAVTPHTSPVIQKPQSPAIPQVTTKPSEKNQLTSPKQPTPTSAPITSPPVSPSPSLTTQKPLPPSSSPSASSPIVIPPFRIYYNPPEKPKQYMFAYKSLPKQKRTYDIPPEVMRIEIVVPRIPLEWDRSKKSERTYTLPLTLLPPPAPSASTPTSSRPSSPVISPVPSPVPSSSTSAKPATKKSASSTLQNMLGSTPSTKPTPPVSKPVTKKPLQKPETSKTPLSSSKPPAPSKSSSSSSSLSSSSSAITAKPPVKTSKVLPAKSLPNAPTSKPAKPSASAAPSSSSLKPPFLKSATNKPSAPTKSPSPSSSSSSSSSSLPAQTLSKPTAKSSAKLPASTPSSSKPKFVIPATLSRSTTTKFTPTPLPDTALSKLKIRKKSTLSQPSRSAAPISFLAPPVSEFTEISEFSASVLGKRDREREEQSKRDKERNERNKRAAASSPEETLRGRFRGKGEKGEKRAKGEKGGKGGKKEKGGKEGRDVRSPENMEWVAFHDRDDDEFRYDDTSQKVKFINSVAQGLLVEVNRNTPEFGDVCSLMRNRGKKGAILRRDTVFEADRIWRVNNPSFERRVGENLQKIGADGGGYVRVFHGTTPESFLKIANEGFRLPDSLMNNDGKGPLFFGRMIYFAQEPGNSLYYSGNHPYTIISDVYPGKCWKHEARVPNLQPADLIKHNFNSIYSETVSTRGRIWAIPDPLQIIPRYLVKLRKIQSDSLYRSVTFDRLPHREFYDRPPFDSRGTPGIVNSNEDFATVWDVRPSFYIHCLVVYKREFSVPPFTRDVIPILQKMDKYIQFLLKEFMKANPGYEFKYGIITNPTQRQLHCHFFSPNKKSAKQARNVLFKKFLPPVIKTPKQVINLIERYGSYDGIDDVAPPLTPIVMDGSRMDWATY